MNKETKETKQVMSKNTEEIEQVMNKNKEEIGQVMDKNTEAKKQGWFKAHKKLCIAISIIIIMALIAIFVVIPNLYEKPETIAEKYINLINNKDIDGVMSIIDSKAGCAYEKCGEDFDKFLETYKTVSKDEEEEYYENKKNYYENNFLNIQNVVDGYEVKFTNAENTEKLADGLYKVKINYHISTAGMELDLTTNVIVYKGKVVSESQE